jgi:hypothetical protein
MLRSKCLKYQNKPEVNTMYNKVSVEHNSNIDKRDELHNNSLKNRRTFSKNQITFIHHNSHVHNNEYMISRYTYSPKLQETPYPPVSPSKTSRNAETGTVRSGNATDRTVQCFSIWKRRMVRPKAFPNLTSLYDRHFDRSKAS